MGHASVSHTYILCEFPLSAITFIPTIKVLSYFSQWTYFKFFLLMLSSDALYNVFYSFYMEHTYWNENNNVELGFSTGGSPQICKFSFLNYVQLIIFSSVLRFLLRFLCSDVILLEWTGFINIPQSH